MHRSLRGAAGGLAAFLVTGFLSACESPGVVDPEAADERRAIQPDLGNLPLYFVKNRGQLDSRVAYHLSGSGAQVYFTTEGLTFSVPDTEGASRWGVKLGFVGARPVLPVGREKTRAHVSYFKGSPEEWVRGAPTYSSLLYRDLWPGIDLRYSGTPGLLKYELLLQPGANPAQIGLAYRGGRVSLNPEGALEVKTPAGAFTDQAPRAVQVVKGQRVEVEASFRLPGPGRGYGFHLGDYDPSLPLVIDPAIHIYSGYIGGSGSDDGFAAAVDRSGNAYVTGYTTSTEATFPEKVGPDLTWNGAYDGYDAFVAKVNPSGTGLVYAGYIGGSDFEYGYGIAVDSLGNAYVTGEADGSIFPVLVGPDLTFNGGADAFVAKVNSSGTSLIYAGYIGGNSGEWGEDIAVDSSGNAYVTGMTSSKEATFPETVGPDLTQNGFVDAFVAKVNPSGTGLTYAGYIGGSAAESGQDIAVDSSGNAYVMGATRSTEATFPVTGGPDLTHNGGSDAFVAKVNPSGKGLTYAGYIGGSGDDAADGMALDSSRNAYVSGYTPSTEATFPVTGGPDLTHNGYQDAYVAKVNPSGTGLVYAGYIGGSSFDSANSVAVDPLGNAYIAGDTSSTQATFPETGGPDLTYNGGGDAFVAKVNRSGTGLVYAGYVGGFGPDDAKGIAVDAWGSAYVTGATSVSEATFPVTLGPDTTYNGNTGGFAGGDAYVTKVVNCTITGTSGADILTGTTGRDVICAGDGNDTVNGRGGNDVVLGGLGSDTMSGGLGDDFLDGGLGVNRASFAGGGAVIVDLTKGVATGQGTDRLISISHLTGSAFGDSLTGNSFPNRIQGGDGEDDLFGLKGNDYLEGEGGNDDLDGDGGTDTCIQGEGTGTLTSCEL